MNKLIVIFFSLSISINCFGQNTNVQPAWEDRDLLSVVPHFSMTLIPYITQKAMLTTQSGKYAPTATNVIGGEAGINYNLPLNEVYSLILGAHVGVAGRNHRLYIAKEEFAPHLDRDVDEYGQTLDVDPYLALPVWLERRWPQKRGNVWNACGGVNVRYITENFSKYYSDYYDVNGQMVKVVDFDLMVGNNSRPWLNYNLGGGYSWLLNNKDFFCLILLINYSATTVVYGDYTINVTGKDPTLGRYTANQAYVALSFNYMFTGVRKIEKKLKL